MSIFELVTSADLVAYWETLANQRAPYLGEELFPSEQKLGLDLKWIKGSAGLPIVLKPSAYDVKAVKRDRIGFSKVASEMPFFKESTSVDEELRQQLNMVMETGNQAYIDAIMKRVFNDEISLLDGARAQRERMRMMLLTTGAISIAANGQEYDYDYGMPANHKVTVSKAWSDPTADIIGDIRVWQELADDETGIKPERAVCSRKTFGYLMNNNGIRNAILGNNSAAPVSEVKVKQYVLNELELSIAVYTKKYKSEAGVDTAFVANDVFAMFPAGALGTGWFGTTPEQSDLMASKSANVTITDVGVAVTTSEQVDPVNVETKVSMIYLPSFEAIDSVIIADVIIP